MGIPLHRGHFAALAIAVLGGNALASLGFANPGFASQGKASSDSRAWVKDQGWLVDIEAALEKAGHDGVPVACYVAADPGRGNNASAYEERYLSQPEFTAELKGFVRVFCRLESVLNDSPKIVREVAKGVKSNSPVVVFLDSTGTILERHEGAPSAMSLLGLATWTRDYCRFQKQAAAGDSAAAARALVLRCDHERIALADAREKAAALAADIPQVIRAELDESLVQLEIGELLARARDPKAAADASSAAREALLQHAASGRLPKKSERFYPMVTNVCGAIVEGRLAARDGKNPESAPADERIDVELRALDACAARFVPLAKDFRKKADEAKLTIAQLQHKDRIAFVKKHGMPALQIALQYDILRASAMELSSCALLLQTSLEKTADAESRASEERGRRSRERAAALKRVTDAVKAYVPK